MEADVEPDTTIRKCTEVAAANRVRNGDNSSAQVNPDPMCLTSFGDDSTKSLVLSHRDDALVDKGAAPKPCVAPVKMRTLTATDGLVLAGKASSATRINFHQPPLCFCPMEEINLKTSIQHATTHSSFWKLKVVQTKTRQTLVFGSGGFTDYQRACSFLGGSRALLCGEVSV